MSRISIFEESNGRYMLVDTGLLLAMIAHHSPMEKKTHEKILTECVYASTPAKHGFQQWGTVSFAK